jgi:hypothetical protein
MSERLLRHNPHLPVMRFWMFSDVRSGYCHGYCQTSVGNEIRLPPPGQVDAEENDRPTEDLGCCETLPKQQHSRGDSDQVYQVLVDQSPVGPHLRDAPLPRPEPEGGNQHRRVGERRGVCRGLPTPHIKLISFLRFAS